MTRDVDVRMRLKDARRFITDTKKAGDGVGRFGTQADKAGRKAKTASRKVDLLNRSAAGSAKSLRRAVGYAVGLGAAYLSIGKAREAVTTTLDLAKGTAGLSKATGLDVKQSSRWVSVMKARGVENKALMMSFGTLSKNIDAAARGGKTQAEMFDRLGVSQDAIKRGDTGEVLGQLADRFKELGDSPERTAAGMKLLGRGWQTVLPLLRDGRGALEETLGAADEFGTTLDEKTLDQMLELVKAQRELKLAGMGLKVSFTKAVTPALTEMSEAAAEVTKILNDPSLTSDEKTRRIGRLGEDLADSIGKKMRDANFGDNLAAGFEAAFPKMTEAAARGSGMAALAFVKGWWGAGAWGKLFTVAVIAAKFGVLGPAFGKLGQAASKKFLAVFMPRLAASMSAAVMAEGVLGTAMVGPGGRKWGKLGRVAGKAFKGGLVAAATIGLYKALEDPFNQALEDLGLAVNASDPTDGEGQRRADERAGARTRARNRRNPHPLDGKRGYHTPGANTIRGGDGPRGRSSVRRSPRALNLGDSIRIEDHTVHQVVLPNGKVLAETSGRAVADHRARQ